MDVWGPVAIPATPPSPVRPASWFPQHLDSSFILLVTLRPSLFLRICKTPVLPSHKYEGRNHKYTRCLGRRNHLPMFVNSLRGFHGTNQTFRCDSEKEHTFSSWSQPFQTRLRTDFSPGITSICPVSSVSNVNPQSGCFLTPHPEATAWRLCRNTVVRDWLVTDRSFGNLGTCVLEPETMGDTVGLSRGQDVCLTASCSHF